ncbi:hypothetical protein CDAR_251291 [Caerostris darwini]|uniref:Uncharacterized protein n=1 Tax=Caerostris darwini TaxID=1538125 RepID=A0AAV4R8X6_9ARAC|nr:hypothetical protein CDAR_251291 [Caerostris darwini]
MSECSVTPGALPCLQLISSVINCRHMILFRTVLWGRCLPSTLNNCSQFFGSQRVIRFLRTKAVESFFLYGRSQFVWDSKDLTKDLYKEEVDQNFIKHCSNFREQFFKVKKSV